MKLRLFPILAGLFFILAFSTPTEKTFNLKFTERQMNQVWSDINGIQKTVDESNLPHLQVKAIVTSLDSLKKIIIPQIQAQLKIDKPEIKENSKEEPRK